ncbi:MAG: hypothetical protein IT388_12015 [Nitrospirales bacterium]|nr:hypothetical protein [Nitrospirales bacterium]
MATLTEKPDTVDEIGQHVDLKRAGANYKGLCPFHSEKTPSFIVNPSRQRYHCFGCGADGDVIDFVQRLKSLSFKEALRYLGIEQGPLTAKRRAEIAEQKRASALMAEFRAWEGEHHRELCTLYRCLQTAKRNCKTPEDMERLAKWYHLESEWVRRLDILEGRDDEEKYELYAEYRRDDASHLAAEVKR